MIELGVNIDHVATLRQARRTYEPDPVLAADEAEAGGADSITVHLREDRRHIQDRDVHMLRASVRTRLNLEMSLSEEILKIAEQVRPDQVTLVPEKREEITTEGGLDLAVHGDRARQAVDRMKKLKIFTSAFLDPDPHQIEIAARLGFEAVELHTGSYAGAFGLQVECERVRLATAAEKILSLGMRLHAGHGLNYLNTAPIAAISGMHELNIGHAIVSRAVISGLRQAVWEMKALIRRAAGQPAS